MHPNTNEMDWKLLVVSNSTVYSYLSYQYNILYIETCPYDLQNGSYTKIL